MTYEGRYRYGPLINWFYIQHECSPTGVSSKSLQLDRMHYNEIDKIICPGCKHFIPSWMKKQVRIRFNLVKYGLQKKT